jgi:hypothetical protein
MKRFLALVQARHELIREARARGSVDGVGALDRVQSLDAVQDRARAMTLREIWDFGLWTRRKRAEHKRQLAAVMADPRWIPQWPRDLRTEGRSWDSSRTRIPWKRRQDLRRGPEPSNAPELRDPITAGQALSAVGSGALYLLIGICTVAFWVAIALYAAGYVLEILDAVGLA